MNDPIIFGQDPTERVVSIEVHGTKVQIFQQNKDGGVLSHERDFFPWLLSSKKEDFGFEPLIGSSFYKYKKTYYNAELYEQEKKDYKNCFTIWNEKEQYLISSGMTYFKNMQVSEISVLSVDIETIGLLNQVEKQVLVIGNTLRKGGKIEQKLFSIDEYHSEKELLLAWAEWVYEVNPSIIIGFNFYRFDLPYLLACAENHHIDLNIGRNNSNMQIRDINKKADKFKIPSGQHLEFYPVKVYGRELIDVLFLSYLYDYKKNYDNYQLKTIAKIEGLSADNRQEYDANTIKDNWNILSERIKIKKYCLDDSFETLQLFDLMIPSYVYISQSVPKTFSNIVNKSTGSQVNSLMMRAYLNDGYSIPRASEVKEYEGAYNFAQAGIYDNVLKVDLISVYPSIMRQFNLYDPKKDPNKYFLYLLNYFTEERLKNKNLYKQGSIGHFALEQSQKVLINSFYGFLATPGLNFNSPAIAEIVTEKGREILNIGLDWTKIQDFEIINADTDSISIAKKNKELWREDEQKDVISSLNSLYPEKINWDIEGSFSKMMVLKSKNYATISPVDGLKLKGSALKASSKEKALQEFILEMVNSLMSINDVPVEEIKQKYLNEIENVTDIHRWVTKKTYTLKVQEANSDYQKHLKELAEDDNLVQGDRFYLFYDEDDNILTVDNFKGSYSKKRLLDKFKKTVAIFDPVLK